MLVWVEELVCMLGCDLCAMFWAWLILGSRNTTLHLFALTLIHPHVVENKDTLLPKVLEGREHGFDHCGSTTCHRLSLSFLVCSLRRQMVEPFCSEAGAGISEVALSAWLEPSVPRETLPRNLEKNPLSTLRPPAHIPTILYPPSPPSPPSSLRPLSTLR